ncbi:MAG: hypothetical protein QXP70_05620, partial [Methanomassiliicoccales archaeon]
MTGGVYIPPPLHYEPRIIGPLKSKEAIPLAFISALVIGAVMHFGVRTLPLFLTSGGLAFAILCSYYRGKMPFRSLLTAISMHAKRRRYITIPCKNETFHELEGVNFLFTTDTNFELELASLKQTLLSVKGPITFVTSHALKGENTGTGCGRRFAIRNDDRMAAFPFCMNSKLKRGIAILPEQDCCRKQASFRLGYDKLYYKRQTI